MAAYDRRSFEGAAAATTLSSGINSTDTTFAITSTTGWPDGSGGDFLVSLDRGLAGEEKILCSSRSGFTVTVSGGVAGRGVDDTSAASHSSGATAEHVLGARDADEANYAVSQTVGKVTTKGDRILASGANTFVRKAAPSNDRAAIADSTESDGWEDYAIPLGYLGSASVTTDQASIGTSTTDLTSLTVAVTARTSRRLKISAQATFLKTTSDEVTLMIREGSTTLDSVKHTIPNGEQATLSCFTIVSGITGSKTYKLSASCDTGTATLDVDASVPRKAWILVEDLGV
jgi:hypothetical protein